MGLFPLYHPPRHPSSFSLIPCFPAPAVRSLTLARAAQMKYLASYLLLQLGGNASPSASDISALLETVGVEAESEQLDKLIAELEGKDINELIAEGSSKFASIPSGGAAAAGGRPAEEKKEEAKEESDDDMGFGLFD
ncbi:60S acidic ribosomal protein P2 [Saitozyma podzolica]|uniref:60S acidic ribosomal protein P2 n=1 Tax=Saitozyma podzolica TaxID=1890683 RepID=A0A427YV69_9TREE|nr:60S acidic ribosomal protein P2 [Saitozyma podzolica]